MIICSLSMCMEQGIFPIFFMVFNYLSSHADWNLYKQKDAILEDLQFLLDDDPEHYPYTLYPQAHGLYPLGVTDNGDAILENQ